MAVLKPRRLDNIDIIVSDLGMMMDFYADVLGLPLHPYGCEPDKGWVVFMCGDVDLALLSVPDANRERHRTIDYYSEPTGVHSFAIQVDDIDEAVATLDYHGVTWAGPLEVFGAGEMLADIPGEDFEGIWYRYRPFYDPEGNVIHVSEIHPPPGFDRSAAAKR